MGKLLILFFKGPFNIDWDDPAWWVVFGILIALVGVASLCFHVASRDRRPDLASAGKVLMIIAALIWAGLGLIYAGATLT